MKRNAFAKWRQYIALFLPHRLMSVERTVLWEPIVGRNKHRKGQTRIQACSHYAMVCIKQGFNFPDPISGSNLRRLLDDLDQSLKD